MKCDKCQVCGEKIDRGEDGRKQCLPVIVADPRSQTRHCWCVCNGCKDEFISRSTQVLKELDEAGE